MMSLKQFKALADRYGADLDRWPDHQRTKAKALLHHDGADAGPALRILARERPLDTAILAAFVADEAESWQDGEQAAALERLRAGVDRRIAQSVRIAPRSARYRSFVQNASRSHTELSVATGLRWIGLSAGSGLAVASGFWFGLIQSATAATPVDLFGALQIAPLSGLWQ